MLHSASAGLRRVVVTGVGLVSPLGIGTEETWQGIVRRTSGIAPHHALRRLGARRRFAGEVKGFDPLRWIDRKDVKKCGRFIQFAIAAADMACRPAAWSSAPTTRARVGVVIGSGIGGFEIIEREHAVLLEKGPDRVSPFFILSSIVNLAAGQVSVRLGAKGPNSAVGHRVHHRRARHRRRRSGWCSAATPTR